MENDMFGCSVFGHGKLIDTLMVSTAWLVLLTKILKNHRSQVQVAMQLDTTAAGTRWEPHIFRCWQPLGL